MAKSQDNKIYVPLLERLKKASRIEQSDVLADSKFFNESDPAVTDIPMLNVALSGDIAGGLTSGLLTIAGPSRHFKSLLGLICVATYMKKHPEAVCMFYDSEFGAAKSYFASVGVDPARVLHNPIENIEVFKFDIINQLTQIKRGEKIVIFIDSIGNLASKKEVDDAINENSAADMTRAKALKGLFRMITPLLSLKDIPMIAINHSYQELGLYPKTVMSGGCVVAGTTIRMADGTVKKIEDIVEGELVITLNGSNIVSHTWNPDTLEDGEPECYTIEFEDGTSVTCSDKHRFIVNGEWVEAQNLIEGMDLTVKN